MFNMSTAAHFFTAFNDDIDGPLSILVMNLHCSFMMNVEKP